MTPLLGQETAASVRPISVAVSDKKAPFYRPELDVLRFLAFFGVFLFHFYRPTELYVQHGIPRVVAATANAFIQGGVFGVDLFFVLSAYLITELLLREKDAFGALDVRSFYMRRILRIWPLYFFYIALAVVPAFNPNHVFSWRYALPFLLLAGNWSIIAYGWPIGSIIGALWTVSIEEQFYLLWPPVVRRISRKGILLAAVGMFLASNLTRIVMVAIHGGMNSVWCNTLCRLDPIVAGILLAVLLKGRVPRFGLSYRLLLLFGGILPLVLIANYWQIHQPETLKWVPTLLGFPAVAISCAVILIAALGSSDSVPRGLLYLGKISYGLYVYHALANLLSNKIVPIHRGFVELALRPVLALAITLALAATSYAFLETPFLQLKKRFTHVSSRPI